MELHRTFELAAGADAAFDAITDLAWALPCVPGASRLGADGDGERVRLALRVDDRRREYEGTVELSERDATARTARLEVRGRALDGADGVTARVTATVVEVAPRRSRLELRMRLDEAVSANGDGRGSATTSAQRLLDQFAHNLDASLAAGVEHDRPATEPSPAGTTSAPAPTGEPSSAGFVAAPVPTAAAVALEDDTDVATSRARPWVITVAVVAAVVVGIVVGRLSQTTSSGTPGSRRRRRKGGRGS